MPASVPVGSAVTVVVQQRAYPAGDGNISAGLGWPVQLFVVNTNGTLLLEGRLINGKAHFEINATVTQVAGAMSLVAQVADRRATGVIHIEPGDPVEPVLVLVGPRSIPADGDHWTMLTALPQDQFGNAVAAGTAVTVRVLHPATTLSNGAAENGGPEVDTVEMISTTTDSLLASVRIYSRTKAGRMDMAAGAGDAHSPERTVMAVPGPPVPFALVAEPVQLMADGRRLVTVATQALVDVNGNLLLDGTAVMFVITGEDGTERRLPAQLIDGKATVQLQAPALPGALHVKALVLNTSSTPLTLDFSAGIGVAPIALRMIPDAETLTLIAGPLLGPLGQYISDGSEVLFTLQATDNSGVPIRVTVPAVAGFAAAVLRRSLLSADTYTVHVDAGVGEGETIIQP